MKFCTILSQLLLAAHLASAAPLTFDSFTTKDGRTFHQVKVVRFTGGRLQFTHATGAAAVQVDLLPIDVQDILEFDAEVAHADMKRIQAERRLAVIESADRDTKRAEELKALKAKIEAMRQIEKTGVQMRLDVTVVTDEGSFCRAWPIVPVEIPGKRDLSGAPLTKPGIKQQTPDLVFVYGLVDPLRGRPLVKIVYPVDSKERPKGAQPYAIDTEIVWLKSKKTAKENSSQPQTIQPNDSSPDATTGKTRTGDPFITAL